MKSFLSSPLVAITLSTIVIGAYFLSVPKVFLIGPANSGEMLTAFGGPIVVDNADFAGWKEMEDLAPWDWYDAVVVNVPAAATKRSALDKRLKAWSEKYPTRPLILVRDATNIKTLSGSTTVTRMGRLPTPDEILTLIHTQ